MSNLEIFKINEQSLETTHTLVKTIVCLLYVLSHTIVDLKWP